MNSNKMILYNLLNSIKDLDSLSYESVRNRLEAGFWFKLNRTIVNKLKHRYNSILTIFSFFTLKVPSPLFSSVTNSTFEIRGNCHRMILFSDEIIEFDLYLKDYDEFYGKIDVNLDKISQSKSLEEISLESNMIMTQDFKDRLFQSKDIFVYLKIPQFSQQRIKYEQQENLLEPELFLDRLNSALLSKIEQLIYENQEQIIYTRSQCWGYTERYWKEHLQGVNIIPWVDNELNVFKLPIKDVMQITEFILSFSNLDISNKTLMEKNDIMKKYESKVCELIELCDEIAFPDLLK